MLRSSGDAGEGLVTDDLDPVKRLAQMAAAADAANGGGTLMWEPGCTPDYHVGEDDQGWCTACGERLEPPDLLRFGLILLAISAAMMLTLLGLFSLWMVSWLGAR